MAKKRAPKAKPLERSAIPHDLSTLSLRTLRATATQTFGIKMTFPPQKRAVTETAMRAAMQMAPAKVAEQEPSDTEKWLAAKFAGPDAQGGATEKGAVGPVGPGPCPVGEPGPAGDPTPEPVAKSLSQVRRLTAQGATIDPDAIDALRMRRERDPDAPDAIVGPIPDPPPADTVGNFEAAMAALDDEGDTVEPGREGTVEDLPDLSRGEAPPAESLAPLVQPEPMIETPREEPVAPTPPPVSKPDPAPKPAGNGFTPVVYRSSIMKLYIDFASPVEGYRDPSTGRPVDPVPGMAATFGRNGNQLCEYIARTPEMVEAIEKSKKFKTGICWRFDDEMKAGIARARGQLAAMEAAVEGCDSATIAQRVAVARGEVAIVQGARHTQIHSTADAPSDFYGLDATLAGKGAANPAHAVRLGTAARDAMRHAQAKGEVR